jgi:hypothetical protein
MKKLLSLHLLIALAVIFASCGSNNNVVNNRLISKRKYNKGFHINSKGNKKSSKVEKEAEGESIAFEDVKSSSKKAEKAAYTSNRTVDNSQDVVAPKKVNADVVVENEQSVKAPVNKPVLKSQSDEFMGDEEVPFEEVQSLEDDQSDNKDISTSEEKMFKKEVKKKARSAARGGNSDLMNILLIVLLVLVILALISLIGGTLGWILSVLVLVLIIYFLLKLLGVI